MCGIVGYVGAKEAAPIVLSGLRRLAYRGYDSAGLAVASPDGKMQVAREAGRLENLNDTVSRLPLLGSVGVGHTRWATHGKPTRGNAHPHSSPDGRLVVVQNGIVENYRGLRTLLEAEGYTFVSETDTEVIVHLLHSHYHNGCAQNLERAVRRTLLDMEGPSAIVTLCLDSPGRLVAARLGNAGGVTVGLGEAETFVASDMPALTPHTDRFQFLADREMAIIEADGAAMLDLNGKSVERSTVQVVWEADQVDKGGHAHYMRKEIFEQGSSLAATLHGRLDLGDMKVDLPDLGISVTDARKFDKVTIVACGTSYYSAMAGKYYLERLAKVPTEVDYASEFRYRSPLVQPSHLVVAITQSGETVDTLAALEEASRQGATTLAIVNAVGSQAARICDGVIQMKSGPEIGVASTKAFTASVTDLLLLAIFLGQARATLHESNTRELIEALATLPHLAESILADAQESGRYKDLAAHFHTYHNFLYLGRCLSYPVAREGALKLKEISYIHAEGYAAGEMKHGPIALIDETMPTVIIAPRDPVFAKIVSQIEQIRARGGTVLAVAQADDVEVEALADYVLPIPATHAYLNPILAVIPLQLFAYEVAVRRGVDVDQPRNLAKSVTVE